MTSISQQPQPQNSINNGTWSLAEKIGWPWDPWLRAAIAMVAFIILCISLQPPVGYEEGKADASRKNWREFKPKDWVDWVAFQKAHPIAWALSQCMALTWSVFPFLSECVYHFMIRPACAILGIEMPNTFEPLYSTIWSPWVTSRSFAFLMGLAVVNFVWRTKKWGLHWMAFIYFFYHPSRWTMMPMYLLIGSLLNYLNL